MGPGFKADQDEGQDGHGYLKALRPLLFGAQFAAAPLCGRPSAEVPDPG